MIKRILLATIILLIPIFVLSMCTKNEVEPIITDTTTSITVPTSTDDSTTQSDSSSEDTTAPSDITDLNAVSGDGNVKLSWTVPNNQDLKGFKICRSDDNNCDNLNSSCNEVYSTNRYSKSWTDKTVTNGTSYCYKIFSFDYHDNYSNGVSISANPVAIVNENAIIKLDTVNNPELSLPNNVKIYFKVYDNLSSDYSALKKEQFTLTDNSIDVNSNIFDITNLDKNTFILNYCSEARDGSGSHNLKLTLTSGEQKVSLESSYIADGFTDYVLWKKNSDLPAGRSLHSSVTYNDYIYIIGGFDGTINSSVYYAKLSSDGTIGTWNTTLSLPNPRAAHSSVVNNGYVYVIGGYYYDNTVYYAKFESDGSLSTTFAWKTANNLPAGCGLKSNASVIYDGYLYVIGGSSSYSNNTNSIYYAKIQSDGSLDNWELLTNSLPVDFKYEKHTAVIEDDYLYVIGGIDTNSNVSDKVYYAKYKTDHTIDTWYTTSSLPESRYSHQSVVYNNHVYVIGGNSTGYNAKNTVYISEINESDNTLGTWQSVDPLSEGIARHSITINDDIIYVIAGFNTGYKKSVYHAELKSDGTFNKLYCQP